MSSIKLEKIVKHAVSGEQHLIVGNRKRRILHGAAKKSLLNRHPNLETTLIEESALSDFEPGAPVPREWTTEHWSAPPQDKQMMREIIVSRLSGNGVEFGAGSRPTRVPVDANVAYAEPYQSAEQYKRMKYNDGVVVPTYINPIENQYEIEDNTLDFIVGAHVIEHTPNPIKAIVESHTKLKAGGHLVLIVPDKRYTFDKPRNITSLGHLITDYEDYKRERDLQHYYEFFEKVKRVENAKEEAERFFHEGLDTHFHVWDPDSFNELLIYIQGHYAPFNHIEVKPRVDDKRCIEFYAVLTK